MRSDIPLGDPNELFFATLPKDKDARVEGTRLKSMMGSGDLDVDLGDALLQV